MVGAEGQREAEGNAECVVHDAFLTLQLLQTLEYSQSLLKHCAVFQGEQLQDADQDHRKLLALD